MQLSSPGMSEGCEEMLEAQQGHNCSVAKLGRLEGFLPVRCEAELQFHRTKFTWLVEREHRQASSAWLFFAF